jgi:hypothetical protein
MWWLSLAFNSTVRRRLCSTRLKGGVRGFNWETMLGISISAELSVDAGYYRRW